MIHLWSATSYLSTSNCRSKWKTDINIMLIQFKLSWAHWFSGKTMAKKLWVRFPIKFHIFAGKRSFHCKSWIVSLKTIKFLGFSQILDHIFVSKDQKFQSIRIFTTFVRIIRKKFNLHRSYQFFIKMLLFTNFATKNVFSSWTLDV